MTIKTRFVFWTISLVTAIMLFACAPAVTIPPPAPPTETLAPVIASTNLPAATLSAPTQIVEVQAVATSRGPNLEATDPATVNLASGQLQLVEFFRFT